MKQNFFFIAFGINCLWQCIIAADAVDRALAKKNNKCPAGGILDSSGKVCCRKSCGKCGGLGCDKRKGGATGCCTSQISASCNAGNLPCILDDEPEVCSNGVLLEVPFGEKNPDCIMQICCPESCSTCSISGDCTGPSECCLFDLYQSAVESDVDVSCRSNEPPCVVPITDDPCGSSESNPCQNGAPCGISFQYYGLYEEGSFTGDEMCINEVVCDCEKVGNYYGQYCESKCGEGETPCGERSERYGANIVFPNNKCCAADEDCIIGAGKYDYEYLCYPKDRPAVCDPNPCMNGAECYNINRYGDPVYECQCLEGFGGTFCEVNL